MQKESLIGQTFAEKYQVTGFLGEGGMARVYVAKDTSAGGRDVALKVVHGHLTSEREVNKRFMREMKIASIVQHPNSVAVYEYGDYNGRLFLAMEIVEGEDLGEILHEHGALPPERVAHIGRQIAAALGAAHAAGVVHRDLKPENVMIDDPGARDVVKVCDFGLARSIGGLFDEHEGEDDDEGSSFQTAVGVRVGTPAYMTPEYVATFEMDHRGDLYALGVLMFEMLCGRPPFTGRPYEVLEAHMTKAPPAPSSINPNTPEWLDKVILKLLAKDPDDRFQIAEEVLVRLERDRGELTEETDQIPRPAELGPGMSVDVPTEEAPREDATSTMTTTQGVVLAGVGVAGIVGVGLLVSLALIIVIGVLVMTL